MYRIISAYVGVDSNVQIWLMQSTGSYFLFVITITLSVSAKPTVLFSMKNGHSFRMLVVAQARKNLQ